MDEETKLETAPRSILILCLIALGVYFAVCTHDGLHAYFTMDDGGNLLKMHKYWEESLAGVTGAALRVVTPTYRPLGGIFYFVLYKLAGFHPLPFRIVCLLLMLVNLYLAFAVLRRLSGSFLAAVLACVLSTNHPALLYLIYSSGTIYEILCFLFYFLALWCYLAWRQAGQPTGATTLSWRQLLAILIFTACALNSKEMAMTLPAALLLVELIYFPPRRLQWSQIPRFVLHQGRAALLTAGLVIPTIAVKVLTVNPLSQDPTYRGHSVHAALDTLRAYQNFLLYGNLYDRTGVSLGGLIALWGAMAALAVLLRSRPMRFGLCFFFLTLIPIATISRRGGYMLYIPLMGWGLYAGSLLQRICDAVIRRARIGFRVGWTVRVAVFAAAAVWIANLHATILAGPIIGIHREQNQMRSFVETLLKIHPHLARGSSLLFLDDPLPSGYSFLFLVQLAYGDPLLKLDRVKMMQEPPSREALIGYDHILAGGWFLHDVHSDSEAVPLVQVRFDPAVVRPRDAYTVRVPEFAGRSIDVAVDTVTGDTSRRAKVLNWCKLDSSGSAALVTPDLPPETVQIRWVRPDGGEWTPAAGDLRIQR